MDSTDRCGVVRTLNNLTADLLKRRQRCAILSQRQAGLSISILHPHSTLKDSLIYYFAMLGKRFGMRQARIWLTFALVKPPDLTGGVCASPCNLIVRDRLTH